MEFDDKNARPDILGAEPDGEGTSFALFSEHATSVELCLFDETGQEETHRLTLPNMEGGVWFGYLPGVHNGQVYGYRVHGPYLPEEGHRFNPNKLLLDPYARKLTGNLEWNDALFGYPIGGTDLEMDERDSAKFMPKGVVLDPTFDWDADKALQTRWEDTFVYEAHVKGLTKQHAGVPESDRGYISGIASDAMIEHYLKLGITAVELLPIHSFVQDRHLLEKGMSNYWGYNTISFFAPHRPYLSTGLVIEMKRAVKKLHAAGIEVILDVVFNHTAEGSELGPTLSFRGIDNRSYYLLSPEAPRHSFDTTGCGNTLNVAHPMVQRMVLDSLRYWVQAIHVDGFRFDLASTLGRESMGFEREGAFFNALRQDPILSQVKLIAEPWDIGEGGYQVGGFPWPFREWNDKARDDLRAFWRRDPSLGGKVSERLLGSPVQFDHSQRPATSSVNFLAAHDGFTLWDVVSYDHKHNDANGEDGRDGHDHNLSHNMGWEGPTDDPDIDASRVRRVRAMLSSLLLSQGVPMILAGDELGHTQNGNNNVYCQDNELAWLDWEGARDDIAPLVSSLVKLRKELGLAQATFAVAKGDGTGREPEVVWHHPEGRGMGPEDWTHPDLRAFGMELALPDGPTILVCPNGGDDVAFLLPPGPWARRLDSCLEEPTAVEDVEGEITLSGQACSLFVRTGPAPEPGVAEEAESVDPEADTDETEAPTMSAEADDAASA